jgi:hypothetical protein
MMMKIGSYLAQLLWSESENPSGETEASVSAEPTGRSSLLRKVARCCAAGMLATILTSLVADVRLVSPVDARSRRMQRQGFTTRTCFFFYNECKCACKKGTSFCIKECGKTVSSIKQHCEQLRDEICPLGETPELRAQCREAFQVQCLDIADNIIEPDCTRRCRGWEDHCRWFCGEETQACVDEVYRNNRR